MEYKKLLVILLMIMTFSGIPVKAWAEPTVSFPSADVARVDSGQADAVWNVSEVSANLVFAYYYKDSGRIELEAQEGNGLMSSVSENLLARFAENGMEKPDETDIRSVKIGKNIVTSDLSRLFSGFANMTSVTFEDADTFTRYARSMREMFSGCGSLTELDVSRFNTENTEYMYSMFEGCSKLKKLDLKSFNTSKVTDMAWMFDGCESLETLDVSRFDTSNVCDMQCMFDNCRMLKKLDVSRFKTSKTVSMKSMFANCSSLTGLDVSGFDTASVMDMSGMFSDCAKITGLDLRKFDTTNVYDMKNMFNGCSTLEVLDTGSFKTPRLGLETDYIVDSGVQGMFAECKELTDLDLSGFDTARVENMDWMFYECDSLKELDLSSFETGNLVAMESMFSGCEELEELNLESFDTSLIKNMNNVFSNCLALEKLDLSGFDLSGVEKPFSLWTCKSLKMIKAPKKAGKDLIIELPGKFYDRSGKIYVNLGKEVPAKTQLTAEKPETIISPNIVRNSGKVLFGLLV
ncbi:MAG: DUF285 domain-containing protein [Lachnospiraceae bacterium]|nr:DUF285 domain-containing protein [Lachnospiraceae bacterium]